MTRGARLAPGAGHRAPAGVARAARVDAGDRVVGREPLRARCIVERLRILQLAVNPGEIVERCHVTWLDVDQRHVLRGGGCEVLPGDRRLRQLVTEGTVLRMVLEAFATSSRTAFIEYSDGLSANNAVKELMLGLGRPYGDMYEVALWEDMVKVVGDELFYAYLVDNQAIVIPETIDAIRALTEIEPIAQMSIEKTNLSLGIKSRFLPDN